MKCYDTDIAIFQVTMTHYRVPIFGHLASELPYNIDVIYGRPPDEQHLHIPPKPWPFRGYFYRMWKLQLGRASPLYFQWREIWAAFGSRYQVLVLTADFHILSYPLASLIAILRGKAVVHWTHGTSLGGPKSKVKEWVRRWLHRRLCHALLLYGERERRFYYETGFDSAKMFVTNNSLDTSESTRLRGQLSQSQLDATRQALGGDVRRMVYAGRLIESKRVDLLIECLPLVHRKFPGAVAVIVGDGPQRAKLEQLAKRLGVQAHVYFLGAIYDEEVLCPILSACDVCVCPGSVGLIVNQAFVYGLPIITSDDHWVHSPEISMVETGVNGLRFRDGDVEALSSAVTSLFAEPDLLLKMKSNALVTISEKFNERAVVAGFHAAISHAMEATRRRRK